MVIKPEINKSYTVLVSTESTNLEKHILQVCWLKANLNTLVLFNVVSKSTLLHFI